MQFDRSLNIGNAQIEDSFNVTKYTANQLK